MELMQTPRFEQLPNEARQHLLESCGSALGTAGEAMQEQIMRSLPSLGGGSRAYHPCSLNALGIAQPNYL